MTSARQLTKSKLIEYSRQLEDTVDLFQERLAQLEFAREDEGWIRLGIERNVEFSGDYFRKIVAHSRMYFLQNPLIHRAVTLQCDYIFAQGLNIQATNDKVNAVIQRFLDDAQNQKEFTAHKGRLDKEQTLMLDGNVFFVLFTDTQDTGEVNLRSILAEEIVDIVTNPDDSNEVWFYKREWYAKVEGQIGAQLKAIYYPDIDYKPKSRPKTRNKIPVLWDAPILHVKTGALGKSRYGVPETLSALDWAKAHTQMLSDWATIIRAYARFAFRVTTPPGKGSVSAARTKLGSTATATNLRETNPAPATGSMFVRTQEGTDIEPIKTSGATTSAKDSRELRIMVAAAMGLPDPMLSGEVDVGNLATAKTLDRPTELKFKSRQTLWTDIIIRMLRYIIQASAMARNGELRTLSTRLDRGGLILDNENNDLRVEVTFPPILEKSVSERLEAITEAVTLNGKHFAIESPELKKLTIRLMLQALGLRDVDDLVTAIFASIDDEDLTNGNNTGTATDGSKSDDEVPPETSGSTKDSNTE
jgi:hypothetical protein